MGSRSGANMGSRSGANMGSRSGANMGSRSGANILDSAFAESFPSGKHIGQQGIGKELPQDSWGGGSSVVGVGACMVVGTGPSRAGAQRGRQLKRGGQQLTSDVRDSYRIRGWTCVAAHRCVADGIRFVFAFAFVFTRRVLLVLEQQASGAAHSFSRDGILVLSIALARSLCASTGVTHFVEHLLQIKCVHHTYMLAILYRQIMFAGLVLL